MDDAMCLTFVSWIVVALIVFWIAWNMLHCQLEGACWGCYHYCRISQKCEVWTCPAVNLALSWMCQMHCTCQTWTETCWVSGHFARMVAILLWHACWMIASLSRWWKMVLCLQCFSIWELPLYIGKVTAAIWAIFAFNDVAGCNHATDLSYWYPICAYLGVWFMYPFRQIIGQSWDCSACWESMLDMSHHPSYAILTQR